MLPYGLYNCSFWQFYNIPSQLHRKLCFAIPSSFQMFTSIHKQCCGVLFVYIVLKNILGVRLRGWMRVFPGIYSLFFPFRNCLLLYQAPLVLTLYFFLGPLSQQRVEVGGRRAGWRECGQVAWARIPIPPAVWAQGNHFPSLSLGFLICKKGLFLVSDTY